MLKCFNCNHVFEEDEADTRREYVGEFWGSSAYETVDICPECGSDELSEFEYPYEGCDNYGQCEFDCENCKYADQKEAEEDEQQG